MYLYRAVDSVGNTIEFHLSKTRDKQAAKDFFKKALQCRHVSNPRVIAVDKNKAYPIAIEQLKKEKSIPIRQQKYLNNIVKQDHRFIKKRIRSMLGLKIFRTAKQIIYGIEVMHMLKRGQLPQREKSVKNEIKFIHRLFGLVS